MTCAPTMHWSGRKGTDTNTSLWASFHIEELPDDGSRGLSFYHAGDTGACESPPLHARPSLILRPPPGHVGYSPSLFEAVGQVLGPVTLAAIPIGSYGPRWHLQLHHQDPLGATHLSQDVGARWSFGVHWGTYVPLKLNSRSAVYVY